MKLSDSFDARRLRPRASASWRWRLCAALAALCAGGGVLLMLAGSAALFGHPLPWAPLADSIGAAIGLLVLGLCLLSAGVLAWRISRRRLRQRYSNELSLSPGLLKKRG